MARRRLCDRTAGAATAGARAPGRAATLAARALVVGALLSASAAVSANWRWCCDNPSHAGGTAAERCESNNAIFPSAARCAAHKAEHDRATGHSSRCEPAAPRTQPGTAPAGSTGSE